MRWQSRAIAVLGSPFGQVVDEGFDLISAGIAKVASAAVIGGIGFHEVGIELMLADQQAETITQARLTVVMAVACR